MVPLHLLSEPIKVVNDIIILEHHTTNPSGLVTLSPFLSFP